MRVRPLLAWSLLAFVVLVPCAEAATSAGCRAGVARSLRRMTQSGLATVESCYAQLNAGQEVGPCDRLPSSAASTWGRRVSRAGATVAFKCPADDTVVRDNYPACSPQPCDNITTSVVVSSQSMIEASTAALAADTPLTGRAARCQRAIMAAQSRIAFHVLQRSQACQNRLDRLSREQFGPLSAQCVAGAGSLAERAGAKIQRACGALTGAEVGSCEPLPECVTDQAQSLGQDLARATYGQPATCGDGERDALEECDDGNTIATDACTDTCRVAVCGDGITWEGMEECDDANPFPNDFCDACHLPVCGDGAPAGDEECDDGNSVPGDGCTECVIDAVLCGAGGIRATITYADPDSTAAAAGVLRLAYPAEVSIPGTGAAGTVRQRVVNVSSAANPIFGPSDTDTNGDSVDDTLALVFGITSPWPPGPMAAITFDCPAETAVRAPDFACSFSDASDAFSNAVDPTKLICSVTALEPIP